MRGRLHRTALAMPPHPSGRVSFKTVPPHRSPVKAYSQISRIQNDSERLPPQPAIPQKIPPVFQTDQLFQKLLFLPCQLNFGIPGFHIGLLLHKEKDRLAWR